MSTNFPGALDSLTNPVPSDGLTGHASQHANANDAIEALQAKVGINSSGDTNSLDYKINHLTKAQVGLGNVDNTSDINKPVSTAQAAADSAVQTAAASDATTKANAAQAAAIAASIPLSQKGTANGVAPLDGTGKVSSTYLPSYVDDVVESATYAALPATGETGKIYVVIADETHSGATTQYRWTGSAYAIITSSPGSTDAVPEGATNLYFTVQRVRDTVLTGLSTATNAVIAATDSVLAAFGKLQAQITGMQYKVVPAGAVFHFAMGAAPTGWLTCDGSEVSRTTYATLFAAIGTLYGAGNGSTTFNLPDLRGEFIRGADGGRGVDVGRVLGSWQGDDFRSHAHEISGASLIVNKYPAITQWSAQVATGYLEMNGGVVGSSGGAETRPRNIALLPCISTGGV